MRPSGPPIVSEPFDSYIDEMDIETCRYYAYQRWRFDYYATTIGASLIVLLGVLGNAGTLFTLSGRRLTTATFVYYRAIACVDLCRCVFVFTYVLRVLVPFRRYYWTSWYEAHLMYFIIGTLGFVSTTLAVFLCCRLFYCILQSKRLKKMHTNAKDTRRIIYGVAAASVLINVWLCFEREVRTTPEGDCSFWDEAQFNGTLPNATQTPNSSLKKYSLAPSEFSHAHPNLLKAIHNIPVGILLFLLTSTLALLLLCVVAFTGIKRRDILSNMDSSNGNSRTWRTQKQLCRLFLFLSLSYTFGLLPSLIYEFFFNHDIPVTSTATTVDVISTTVSSIFSTASIAEAETVSYQNYYENLLANITRRQISATILNVFQNLAHAISFYLYFMCSEEFRNEFFCKIRRISHGLHRAYSSFRSSRTRTMKSSPLLTTRTILPSTPVHYGSRRQGSIPEAYRFEGPLQIAPCPTRNTRVAHPRRRKKMPLRYQEASLSEYEGDDVERVQVRKRSQTDLRFCRRVKRELSAHFYPSGISNAKEANGENVLGHLLGQEFGEDGGVIFSPTRV